MYRFIGLIIQLIANHLLQWIYQNLVFETPNTWMFRIFVGRIAFLPTLFFWFQATSKKLPFFSAFFFPAFPITPGIFGKGWKSCSDIKTYVDSTSISPVHTVDGRNPASQLRVVVYPIIYRVCYIPGDAGVQPSRVLLVSKYLEDHPRYCK